MKIKGIIFDKDGTLLDFAATWVPVLHEAASAAAGRDESRAETLLAVGGWEAELGRVKAGSLLAAGNTVEIAAAWAEHLPGRDVAELVPLLDRVFRDGGARHATPVTALGPLFQRLKSRGLALGVATSDSLAGAHASLAAFDVLEQLDFLAGYDSGHGAKPGPGMVEGFCRATGLAAFQVAMVGDNLHDLEMGRRAGAGLVVGVLTGNSGRGELATCADHVLDSIEQLEALLEEL
jgi:phosphoglycolate phosphatase